MFRSTISYLLILEYCLGSLAAKFTTTASEIRCEQGFDGLRGFRGPEAAKRDCYMSLNLLVNDIVRPQKKILHDIRNRETGKPLRASQALENILVLTPNEGYRFEQSPKCGIWVEILEYNDQPSRQNFDLMLYFYFWERVEVVAKQILEQCFEDEHRWGYGDPRPIGQGVARIDVDKTDLEFRVWVDYFGEKEDQGGSPASRSWEKVKGACRRVKNSLLCRDNTDGVLIRVV